MFNSSPRKVTALAKLSPARTIRILPLLAAVILLSGCVVYPDVAVVPAPGVGADVAEAGVAAADIGLAAAAPGGFWGGWGGGWWGGTYQQNNYYNYNRYRPYNHWRKGGYYRHFRGGAFRGDEFHGGGFRGGGRR